MDLVIANMLRTVDAPFEFVSIDEKLELKWIIFWPNRIRRGSAIKLHVSAGLDNAVEVLARVIEILDPLQVPFKVAGSRHMLRMLNAGFLGYTQIGKFITIYPSDRQLRVITLRLREALSQYGGPHPPSDYQIENSECMSYRFGVHAAEYDFDNRSPLNPVPDYVVDPILDLRQVLKSGESLATHGIHILKTIRRRGRGGLFQALLRDPLGEMPRLVLLKEACSQGERDANGVDARARMVRERSIIKTVGSKNLLHPLKVVDLGTSEFTAYPFLSDATDLTTYQGEFSDQTQRTLFVEGVEFLRKLHASGYVWNDLSPSNVLFSNNSGIVFVDFENVTEIGESPSGVSPMFSRNTCLRPSRYEDDYYSLIKTIFWMSMTSEVRFDWLESFDIYSSTPYRLPWIARRTIQQSPLHDMVSAVASSKHITFSEIVE